MSAILSATGQLQNMPMTQALQPTNLDQSRDVERQEFEPQEHQIQAQNAPSAQTQTSNESKDPTVSLNIKDLLKRNICRTFPKITVLLALSD